MLWLVLAFAAAVAVILWKVANKTQPPPRTSRAADTDTPVTLAIKAASESPAHAMSESRPNVSLEKDAWEDWSDVLYAEASRELPAELTITYCDRNGQITHRDISVEKYATTKDGGVLAAFCHIRQARRPFYFSRIQRATNRIDGTIIKDLGAWLDERYEASPRGARDRFLREHEGALGALFFVAKADDAFRAKEKGVMRSFCATQGLHDTEVQELVVDMVSRWVVPSRIAYGKDLRSLLERDEPYRRAVLEHAQAIVGTGRTVRDAEERAIERMQRELKLPPKPKP